MTRKLGWRKASRVNDPVIRQMIQASTWKSVLIHADAMKCIGTIAASTRNQGSTNAPTENVLSQVRFNHASAVAVNSKCQTIAASTRNTGWTNASTVIWRKETDQLE